MLVLIFVKDITHFSTRTEGENKRSCSCKGSKERRISDKEKLLGNKSGVLKGVVIIIFHYHV